MYWNWQQANWPTFTFTTEALEEFNLLFIKNSSYLSGAYNHISKQDKDTLTVDLLSDEAYKTSEIEGEFLNRDSLRSSICRELGLPTANFKMHPRERGISELMVNLYHNFSTELTHTTLFNWHFMLTRTRRDIDNIGTYRTHIEAMEIISGSVDHPKVHFVAPPSNIISKEMDQFIAWYNQTAPRSEKPLYPLIRAGIAHLYFVSIHPFEDGNGRIARALVEKALSQYLGRPTLIALSHVIQKNKKAYYSALEQANKSNEITEWLIYFAKTILSAQDYTQSLIEFLIDKTKFYDKFRGQLNDRQEKVVARMFLEGVEGFKGGLSAENYIRITNTSRATTTRDLQDMVDKGMLNRKGERKNTRYTLNLKNL